MQTYKITYKLKRFQGNWIIFCEKYNDIETVQT